MGDGCRRSTEIAAHIRPSSVQAPWPAGAVLYEDLKREPGIVRTNDPGRVHRGDEIRLGLAPHPHHLRSRILPQKSLGQVVYEHGDIVRPEPAQLG